MLTQARRTIALYMPLDGRALMALFERRSGGRYERRTQETRLPWGGTYHAGLGYQIEPLTLERSARWDALPGLISAAQSYQQWGLMPLEVFESEYDGVWKVREHRWRSCLLLSSSPGDSDIGADEMAVERITLQPHYYELALFDEGIPEGKVVLQVPPLSPWLIRT